MGLPQQLEWPVLPILYQPAQLMTDDMAGGKEYIISIYFIITGFDGLVVVESGIIPRSTINDRCYGENEKTGLLRFARDDGE